MSCFIDDDDDTICAMSAKSKAQARAMFAAAAGDSTIGIPKKVGKEFSAAQHKAGPGSVKKLPARKKK